MSDARLPPRLVCMKRFWVLLLLALSSLSIAACTGGALPDVECDDDIPDFKDVKLLDDCSDCHSTKNEGSERRGAPGGINFDKYDDAAASAEIGVEAVFAGVMPPGGAELKEDEELDFYKWALCGTPE